MLASNTSAISVARRAAEAKARSDLSRESAIAWSRALFTEMCSCGALATQCQYEAALHHKNEAVP